MTDERPDPESDDGGNPTDPVDEHRPERDDRGALADRGQEDSGSTAGRIPIDLRERANDDGRANGEGGVDDGPEEDEYGPEPRSTPIEPGAPTLEHAVFVVLGALAMIAVVLRMASITM